MWISRLQAIDRKIQKVAKAAAPLIAQRVRDRATDVEYQRWIALMTDTGLLPGITEESLEGVATHLLPHWEELERKMAIDLTLVEVRMRRWPAAALAILRDTPEGERDEVAKSIGPRIQEMIDGPNADALDAIVPSQTAMEATAKAIAEVEVERRPADEPTQAAAGSLEKIAVMTHRHATGQALYHPQDNRDVVVRGQRRPSKGHTERHDGPGKNAADAADDE
jgi:hypothetical protein